MPRLFTALELPPTLTRDLALYRGGLPGARWIDPENYHVTLRFIGDVDQATARSVAENLRAGETRPPTITLDALDGFEAAPLLRERRPGVRIVLCSGWVDDEVHRVAEAAGIERVLSPDGIGVLLAAP